MFDENKLEFKTIPYDRQIINDLEVLKKTTFANLGNGIIYEPEVFDAKSMTGLMATYDGEVVAGCFVCNQEPILYISSLFVKNEYQRCGYHIGKQILLKTLQQKVEFEKYYEKQFHLARMYALNEKLRNLYLSWGFEAPYDSLLVQKAL